MRRSLVIALLTGCYAPVAPAGAPCGDNGACPAGLACTTTAIGDRCLPITELDAQSSGDGPPQVCTPKTLLAGGVDPSSQGWAIARNGGTSTISLGNGITTLTTSGGALQLLILRDAIPVDRFVVEAVVEVVNSGGHVEGRAAIALMMSFHDPAGDATDTSRMLALDNTGMALGGASTGIETRQLRTYRIERTTSGSIRATAGSAAVSTGPFTTNGTIAIGDQTTNAGLDSAFQISSIALLCP